MKKKIFITMLAVIMLTIFAVTASAFALGDVNGDGSVKAADARLALRYSAKLEFLHEDQLIAADVDKSGKVTASDARKILREAASLSIGFDIPGYGAEFIDDGVLHVAVCVDNAPFAYADGDEIKGINIELAKKIAEHYDLELRLHGMDENELADSVKNNQCDIAFANVDYEDNNYFTGITWHQYYDNELHAYMKSVLNYHPTINDFKGENTKTVGVVENSIADVMITRAVDKGELNCKIKRYSRVIDGKKAVKDKSIDAFISPITFPAYQGTAPYFTLIHDRMYIIASDTKQLLLEMLVKPVSDELVNECVGKFCPTYDDSSLSLGSDLLIMPLGGTAIIKIDIDSYYGHAIPTVVSSPYQTSIASKELEPLVFEYYLVISIPDDAENGTIRLEYMLDSTVSCELQVQVETEYGGVYNFGAENSDVPDFGSLMCIAPDDVFVHTRDKEGVEYIHKASSLINAGVTNEHLEYYFSILEQQGFECIGENVGYSTYELTYRNKDTGEVMIYTEKFNPSTLALDRITIYLLRDF